MRIISKFHDYYDSAMSEGQDRSLVFLRETTKYPNCQHHGVVPAPLKAFVQFAWERAPARFTVERRAEMRTKRVEVDYTVIMVAGKLHPIARVEFRYGYGPAFRDPVSCYTFAELAAVMAEFDEDLVKRDKGLTKNRSFDGSANATNESFFSLAGSEQLRDHAMAHRLALVSWEQESDLLQLNPQLSQYQLYQHLHAWQVFQELSMFFGNLAAPDNTPVTVSDKDRIAQHGYDKWSFRRMPEKG